MGLDERVILFLLGCLIGAVLGYVTRLLQEIKKELDEVDEIVKRPRRDEAGFSRFPIIMDIALLTVVALTVWASFASQKASNDVKETQNSLSQITLCNQEFLSKMIVASSQRTTYATEQVQANIELQKAQAAFLGLLLQKPPASEKARVRATKDYLNTLTDYVTVNGQVKVKFDLYPYPTIGELSKCLSKDQEGE